VVALTFLKLHLISAWWVLGLMLTLYFLSLLLKNSSIVDILWGIGFVVSAWLAFYVTLDTLGPRDWLIVILVTIWGLRLSGYVLWRNASKGEDFRYAAWRQEHPDQWWWRSFFQVFVLQGFIMWVVAAPLTAVQLPHAKDALSILDFIGLIVWCVGFFFEVVGDAQLSHFKANPANQGKVLKTGVWRLTRHPNYFGDAAQWWGFFLIAAASGAWWTVFSPILMTYLLIRVSGMALLERTLKQKPGYQAYINETSGFIPWLPKKRLKEREEQEN
jgi:steroid 5-alpha reductase family enzyme